MVQGLNLYCSMILLPFTIFVFAATMINPIVKLECLEGHGFVCKDRRLSKFDDNYDEWRYPDGNNMTRLQADGNLTLTRFSHGFVPCYSDQCKDCTGKKECADYNYTQYESLLADIEEYNANKTAEYGVNITDDELIELPGWMVPDCACLEFCGDCDEQHLIKLPGNMGHVQGLWAFLDCQEITREWMLPNEEPVCDLFNNFFKVVTAGAMALLGIGVTFMWMCFLEYVNFHLFCSGNCKCLFISPWKKKIMFVVMLTGPLFLLIWLLMNLYQETDRKLNAYFDAVGVAYKYNWNTRGYIMWWICIGNVCLSILAILVAGKTERHLVTMNNYRRGIDYANGETDPLKHPHND